MTRKISLTQLAQTAATLNDTMRWDGTSWVAAAPSGGAGVTDGDKGDITVSATGATWTIDPNAVTLPKLAQVSTATILGRSTAATGNVEALTGTQATALLDTFALTTKGLVPAPSITTGRFLKDDGTWDVAGGSAFSEILTLSIVNAGFESATNLEGWTIVAGSPETVNSGGNTGFNGAPYTNQGGAQFLRHANTDGLSYEVSQVVPCNAPNGGTVRLNVKILQTVNLDDFGRIAIVPVDAGGVDLDAVTYTNVTAGVTDVFTTVQVEKIIPNNTASVRIHLRGQYGAGTITNVAFDDVSATVTTTGVLPSLLGNSGKVLAANATETGVEWVAKDDSVAYALDIINPSFETGDATGWTLTQMLVGGTNPPSSHTVTPFNGIYLIYGADNSAEGTAVQTVNVATDAFVGIDNGSALFSIRAYGTHTNTAERGELNVRFLTAADALLDTASDAHITDTGVNNWQELLVEGSVPVGTRKVEITLRAVRLVGTVNNYAFDSVSGTITTGAFSIGEAPGDGALYGRQDNTWVAFAGALSDGDKGDITVSGTGATWTIDPNAVTLSKLAQVPTATFLGRSTAATGNVEALTSTQATALLDTFGLSSKGLVPPPTTATGRYLKDDGTWAIPEGSGGGGSLAPATHKGVRAYRGALTITTTGAWVQIPFTSTHFDTNVFWNVANPTRLTIPAEVSKVRLTFSFRENNVDPWPTSNQMMFYRNGGALSLSLGGSVSEFPIVGYNNSGFSFSSGVVNVTAGDFFEISVFFADSGAIAEAWFELEVLEASTNFYGSEQIGLFTLQEPTNEGGAGSTSAFATKGGVYTATQALEIIGTSVEITTTGTYKLVIATVDTGNIITAIKGETAPVSKPLGLTSFLLPSIASIATGDRVAILIVRTDGTNVSPVGIPYAGSGGRNLSAATYSVGLTHDSNNPIVGTDLDSTNVPAAGAMPTMTVLYSVVSSAITPLIDPFTTTTSGFVPAPLTSSGRYLRDDGTWATVTGVTDGDKGDITVTGTGATWTVDANAITLAKLAQVSTATILGRSTAATGNVETLTGTQATALLDTFALTTKGLVPAPSTSSGRYLRDDGTWFNPPIVTTPYSLPLGFTTTPSASEVLLIHVFAEAVTFPADLAGLAKYIGTNPTSSFVLTLKKNDVAVGTVTVSTAGAVTGSTTGSPVSFVIDDVLTVEGPASPDTTISNCAFTFKGARA